MLGRAGALTLVTALAVTACSVPTGPMGVPASQPGPAEPFTTPTDAPGTTSTPGTTPGTTPDPTRAAREPGESSYERIAVVGCSQTRDAVHGFNAIGDVPIFGSDQDQEYLSAGTIDRWAANGGHWRRFAALHGGDADVEAVWIMLCWHVRNTDPSTSVETVGYIIDRAHEVIGHDVPVFVSGLNDWNPRAICPKADWASSWALADEAVAAGLAERGPELGPITEEQTTDGCHGTTEGNAVMGAQLASFFPGG
jgi:hypothetical protein